MRGYKGRGYKGRGYKGKEKAARYLVLNVIRAKLIQETICQYWTEMESKFTTKFTVKDPRYS
ncbi:MAG: hypothetical protein ACJAVI_001768 [Candidatus Azotimanducaceae bacterium]